MEIDQEDVTNLDVIETDQTISAILVPVTVMAANNRLNHLPIILVNRDQATINNLATLTQTFK